MKAGIGWILVPITFCWIWFITYNTDSFSTFSFIHVVRESNLTFSGGNKRVTAVHVYHNEYRSMFLWTIYCFVPASIYTSCNLKVLTTCSTKQSYDIIQDYLDIDAWNLLYLHKLELMKYLTASIFEAWLKPFEEL